MGWRQRRHPRADGIHRAPGLRGHQPGAVRRRGPGRGAGGHRDRGLRHPVRLPRPAQLRMGAAAAAGDAGLRGGLRLHRLPAVQRPGPDLAARQLRLAGPRAAGDPQHARRGLGLRVLALSLCLPAGPHGPGRARGAPDGSGAPARGAAVAPHPARGPAARAPGGGRRRGAGPDGDPGRLRRGQLLRHPDLHHRHLQGLAVHGQPHRRGAAGHPAAGRGGGAACAGAPGPAPPALRRLGGRAGRRRRGPARAAARGGLPRGLAGLRLAGPHGVRVAGAVHAAAAAGRWRRAPALGPLLGLGLQQRAARGRECRPGGGGGAAAGVQPASPSGPAGARRRAAGGPGLRRAGRGDRRGPAAAGRLAAGRRAAGAHRLLGDRHGAGHHLGLPGALHVGRPAVGAERLRPHPGQHRRHRAHAGDGRVRAAAAGAPPRPRRCWCSST